MFGKISVLIAAALALAACETQSGAVMTPPLSKTGTANPDQAPVSYMVFFNLGSTKLSDQDQNTVAQAAQVYKTKPGARVSVPTQRRTPPWRPFAAICRTCRFGRLALRSASALSI